MEKAKGENEDYEEEDDYQGMEQGKGYHLWLKQGIDDKDWLETLDKRLFKGNACAVL